MTRFARAKGSKASNERAPEEATPWEVMKGQLVQAKKDSEEASKRLEAENKRVENYENFLKEQKTQKRQATWCDFPEEPNRKIHKRNGQQQQHKEKKNKKKNQNNLQSSVINNFETKVQNNSIHNKQETQAEAAALPMKDNVTCDTINNLSENTSPKKSKKKNKNKKQNIEETSETNTNKNESVSEVSNVQSQKPGQENNNKNKKKKNKQEQQHQESNNVNYNNMPNNNPQHNHNLEQKQKKNKKLLEGKPVRRKAIDDNSFQLIVNGKEVDLIRYDGFPIMKRDAERLEELKKNMIKKGIPKSEVQRTMKLERRRAEKALARLKRDVCYNCRKGGHNLSDCPELKSKIPGVAEAADGVCFKCGSTEHRQFECKVQREKEFRFASCFICREQGHIARQCPDNPKGLYPNGGGCKLCGDVTHLRKDCPTSKDKKEESAFKLQTIDNLDNLEGIGQEQVNSSSQDDKPKKPKKIMF